MDDPEDPWVEEGFGGCGGSLVAGQEGDRELRGVPGHDRGEQSGRRPQGEGERPGGEPPAPGLGEQQGQDDHEDVGDDRDRVGDHHQPRMLQEPAAGRDAEPAARRPDDLE
ncbi:hypothetical protein ACIQMY_30155 [Streptomyces sp. NPDC091368]|uniref:hypothetical protein n=1 Tax=Streptomyces sp. NPDC091368 TaxID=3365993 RepID=UPI0037FC0914